MKEIMQGLPIIALRGMTILPYMVIHFDVSRKHSINSVDYAIKNGQKIFLVAQHNPDVMNPTRDDIYNIGTLCEIKQVVKMPGGLMRVLVKGLNKGILVDFNDDGNNLSGNIEIIKSNEVLYPTEELQARVDYLKELLKQLYYVNERALF